MTVWSRVKRPCQITIPKEVREALSLETGDRVELVAEEKRAYRVVAATRDVRHSKR